MVPIEKVNKVQMGNQNSTKPLENLQLDIEKANVQVNVSVNVEDVNVFIDFRISEILICALFLAISICLIVKMPCKKCRSQPENTADWSESNLHLYGGVPSNGSGRGNQFLVVRTVESGMYRKETQPFIIESAKTYV